MPRRPKPRRDPTAIRLYGLHEAAEYLEVTLKNLSVMRNRGQIVAPVAELKCGPVWSESQLLEQVWAWRSRGRRAAVVRARRPIVEAQTKRAVEDARRETARLEERLAELDTRWEKLVDAASQHEMPAGDYSSHGRKRSGLQIEARGRKVSRGAESATALLRRHAETKLLSLVADRADKDKTFAAIRDELDEAWQLREALTERMEAAAGF